MRTVNKFTRKEYRNRKKAFKLGMISQHDWDVYVFLCWKHLQPVVIHFY